MTYLDHRDRVPIVSTLVCMVIHKTRPMIMVWNIGKYGYIGTWILRLYRKYRRNIGEYFDKNFSEVKIIQNSLKYLEKLQKQNDKISKKTHVKVNL